MDAFCSRKAKQSRIAELGMSEHQGAATPSQDVSSRREMKQVMRCQEIAWQVAQSVLLCPFLCALFQVGVCVCQSKGS